MSVARLAVKTRSGSVAPARVLGTTPIALGGVLDRESAITNDKNSALMSNCAAQVRDEVFAAHKTAAANLRLYKLFPTAVTLRLTGALGGTLPLAGELVTGGNSSAQGTMIEDYVAGDTFVKVIPTVGAFENNDPLTFAGGATGGQTTGSGNPEDNGGEWGVDHEQTHAGAVQAVSGLHHVILPTGISGLCLIYETGGNWHVLVYNPAAGTWSNTDKGAAGAAVGADMTKSFVYRNIIYWSVDLGGVRAYATYNPQTDLFVAFSSNLNDEMSMEIGWLNRVFSVGGPASGSVDQLRLSELAGGVASVVDNVPAGAASDIWLVDNETAPPGVFVGDDNALYVIESIDQGSGINRQVVRYSIDEAGAIIRNCPIQSGQAQIDIGEALLPASRREDTTRAGDFWLRHVDIETDPLNPDIRLFYFASPASSGVEYRWQGWQDIGVGSIVGTTVTFPSSHGLVVGDWVRHNDTNKTFRVSSTPTGLTATIDPSVAVDQGWALPAADSQWSKMLPLFEEAPSGTLIGYNQADDPIGGGTQVFSVGELHAEWAALPVRTLGGVTLSTLLFGGGVVEVRGWYRLRDGVLRQMTPSGPAQTGASPSVNLKVIEAVNADGVNPLTFKWEASADAVDLGDVLDAFIEVSV